MLPLILCFSIPLININFFILVFFLEIVYWITISQNFIIRIYPIYYIRVICFSAIERASLFSILISIISKIKNNDFF